MRSLLVIIALHILTVCAPVQQAAADEPDDDGSQAVMDEPETKIESLKWESKTVSVESEVVDEAVEYWATFNGSYSRREWSLIEGEKVLHKPRAPPVFVLRIPLRGEDNSIDLTCIGPDGATEHEVIHIRVPGLEKAQNADRRDRAQRLRIRIGLGIVSLNCEQSTGRNLHQTSMMIQGFARYSLSTSWEATGGVSVNALTLAVSPVDARLLSYGGDARLGYIIPLADWRLTLTAGGYYRSTFARQNAIGYENIFGPAFAPVFSRRFSNRSLISAYIKAALVSAGGFLDPAMNRELSAGAEVWLPGGQAGLSLEWSDLRVGFDGAGIKAQQFVLGVSYAL